MTIKAVLTDIEGTTTDIAFVHDTLFPYARARMAEFITNSANQPEVSAELARVSEIVGRPLPVDQAAEQLDLWMQADKKIAPLKSLQGMIWAQGYADGSLEGHMYEDAVAGLKRWKDAGLDLYVYSSGSVQAQKLIFGHTNWGDLTPLFSGYFDTAVGQKREAASYQKIAASTGYLPEHILFLSDIEAELDAAAGIGMHTAHLQRKERCSSGHSVFENFSAIQPEHPHWQPATTENA